MDISSLWAQAVHVFSDKLRPGTPEFGLVVYVPLAYWIVAGFYELLDWLDLPATQRSKLTRREPGRDNMVSRQQVVIRVLLQHFIQTVLALAVYVFDDGMCDRCAGNSTTFLHRATRFVLGMYVMDTWQYWIHRMMHTSTFLYKHLHSVHHSLMIPFACGALYNSILEGLLLDSLGGVVTHYVSGMDCQTATWLFIFANAKTVVDHCNYRGPINPLHSLFPNSAAYHDAHHDIRGIKMNFSQPFFTHWDWLLGTFLDPAGMHLTEKEQEQRAREKQVSRFGKLRPRFGKLRPLRFFQGQEAAKAKAAAESKKAR
ncbi:hypothetical protein PLESTB_000901000 [Pleodorina starrii]|uniref:Fatty acid hydroxylase domain-containing protein n=1 Tax=Pleodorina starrii TaxID=330485 RepID=A0A9W6BMA2_9CHLO|nr:hypothetical protein PLESTM_001562900 [Pleodorina starrii]GLC54739.1 hypothetical protein PLESTB_000901000 [Pleodorina starrii]GLC68341.1 hypothetical protein PLESTF_000680900 [Pleodorina starrii]